MKHNINVRYPFNNSTIVKPLTAKMFIMLSHNINKAKLSRDHARQNNMLIILQYYWPWR